MEQNVHSILCSGVSVSTACTQHNTHQYDIIALSSEIKLSP